MNDFKNIDRRYFVKLFMCLKAVADVKAFRDKKKLF